MPAAKIIEDRPRSVFQAEQLVVARAEALDEVFDMPADRVGVDRKQMLTSRAMSMRSAIKQLHAARKEAAKG